MRALCLIASIALVVAGPALAIGLVLGVLAALYILTDVSVALYGLIATMASVVYTRNVSDSWKYSSTDSASCDR